MDCNFAHSQNELAPHADFSFGGILDLKSQLCEPPKKSRNTSPLLVLVNFPVVDVPEPERTTHKKRAVTNFKVGILRVQVCVSFLPWCGCFQGNRSLHWKYENGTAKGSNQQDHLARVLGAQDSKCVSSGAPRCWLPRETNLRAMLRLSPPFRTYLVTQGLGFCGLVYPASWGCFKGTPGNHPSKEVR